MDAMEDGFSWENPHFPTEVTHDHTAKRKGREEKVLEVLEEPKKKKLMKDQKGKSVKVEEEEEEDKGKLWKDDEIEILIALHGEMDKEFLRNSKKQGIDMWHKLHARLLAQIPLFKKSHSACKKKFNSLFKTYKNDKITNTISGESRHESKFYDEFDIWFSHTGSVKKHVTASATDTEVALEENDEPDTELEDSTEGSARRSSVSKTSGKRKFHDEALLLFGEMVETSKGVLQSFRGTGKVLKSLDKQMDRLIDKL